MAFSILYAEEKERVHRHSSIDQFKNGFLSAWKQGGWAPILFDQLDSIGECSGIKSHPVIISFGNDLGYIYPEKKCTYVSDKFIFFDEQQLNTAILPSCFGGNGEFYEYWTDKSTLVNFDNDSSVGSHNETSLRVGLEYIKCSESLPPVE